ncbi:MAG: PstS family phosphate ABC transporter substrate-binding protein [Streptosporangiaceae bacterium]
MRMLTKLLAGVITGAAATALAVTPALADPPSGVTPKPTDIVGVGSNTTQYLFDQFSNDYNASHSTGSKLYSWDAVNPKTLAIGDPIKFKSGCTTEPRPDGSSAGITALATNLGGTTGGNPCLDFARSSRARKSTDPPFAPGGVAFVALARDAITWATQATTNAPATLTVAQLNAIYTCKDTNWDQVGGKDDPIKAFIPQSGSGTAATFLTDIGVTTVGKCVSSDNNTLEENEGINSVLHTPDAIVPYSIGAYVSQVDRSAKCLKSGCTPVSGVICKPGKGQNAFGCDLHGTMALKEIAGKAPTTGSASAKTLAINPGFLSTFFRTLYDVVRYSSTTSDHIPAYLEPFFGAKGYFCTSATAKTDIGHYGFLTVPNCGATS